MFTITSAIVPLPYTVNADTNSISAEIPKSIQFMNPADPNTLKHMDSDILNQYVLSILRKLKYDILELLRKKYKNCERIPYIIFKIATHGNITFSADILINSDFSVFRLGNATVNYLKVYGAPGFVNSKLRRYLNREVFKGKMIWLGVDTTQNLILEVNC